MIVVFERNEADFAAIVLSMAKNTTKLQPKTTIRNAMNKFLTGS
jgi:hypothetical protein